MRAMLLILPALVLPTVAAMPPLVQAFTGIVDVETILAGRPVCAAEAPATLLMEQEMESATFLLAAPAACGSPALAFRGALDNDGWRFVDPAGAASGAFRHSDDGMWRLSAMVDTCPELVICEFPHGVRVRGDFVPFHPFLD